MYKNSWGFVLTQSEIVQGATPVPVINRKSENHGTKTPSQRLMWFQGGSTTIEKSKRTSPMTTSTTTLTATAAAAEAGITLQELALRMYKQCWGFVLTHGEVVQGATPDDNNFLQTAADRAFGFLGHHFTEEEMEEIDVMDLLDDAHF